MLHSNRRHFFERLAATVPVATALSGYHAQAAPVAG
jgi:hypothetical protein